MLQAKKDTRYDQINFGKLISKLSQTQVILLKDLREIRIYLKKNLFKDELIIGMGAGLISKSMRELERTI